MSGLFGKGSPSPRSPISLTRHGARTWVTLWARTWVTLSPLLDGSERVFASQAEQVPTSSQTPFLLPLRACAEVCTSSCSPYEISLKNAESVTHVLARSVTHVLARCPPDPSPIR